MESKDIEQTQKDARLKTKQCAVCGTIFDNKRSGGGFLGQKQFLKSVVCSIKCSGIWQTGKHKPKHTEEWKQQISKRMKEYHAKGLRVGIFTPEVRKKMSESRLRGIKEGRIHFWNKGIPMSEETKKRLRETNTGRKLSPERKQEFSEMRKREWANGERVGGWKISPDSGRMKLAKERIQQKVREKEMREKQRLEKLTLREEKRKQDMLSRPKCGECGKTIRRHNKGGMCSRHKSLSDYFRETARLKYHSDLEESRKKGRELARKYRDKKQAYDMAYRKKNAKKIDTRVYQWRTQRKQRDPLFRFKEQLRCRVSSAFRSIKKDKPKQSFLLLGGSLDEIKKHIEKQFTDGMTWQNYGKWHADHIIPICSAQTQEEMIKLCHYMNLQPLWALDNYRKGKKIIKRP